MADERVQRLRRRFEETGTFEDELAWLQARYRAGKVSALELRVASLCDHAAAQAVLSSVEMGEFVSSSNLTDLQRFAIQPRWRQALWAWTDAFVCLEARAAAIRLPLPGVRLGLLSVQLDPALKEATLDALGKTEAAAVHGSKDAEEQSIRSARELRSRMHVLSDNYEVDDRGVEVLAKGARRQFAAINGLIHACKIPHSRGTAFNRRLHATRIRTSISNAQFAISPAASELDEIPQGAASALALGKAEVAGWILGYSDPVRDRLHDPTSDS